MSSRFRALVAGLVVVASVLHGSAKQRPQAPAAAVSLDALTPTVHPPLPRDPSRLWLAPVASARASTASAGFSRGVRLHGEARYAEALPLVRASLANTPLVEYGQYYTALTELRLSRLDEAQARFEGLAARAPQGYVGDAARLRLAEIAELRGDLRAATARYTELAESKGLMAEDVLLKAARTAHAAGDLGAAASAWMRVYYEFPLSDAAALAQAQLDTLQLWQPLAAGSARLKLELGRAERLFASRRYAQARSALEPLQPIAEGDTAELVALRLAECDFYLKRFAATREAMEPWTRKASRRAEAQFFYLSAMRELSQHDEFVRLSRDLVTTWPRESWAEETLNNLATHYILVDDDAGALGVFREVLERFPASRHAQRAGWKVGWAAYRQSRFDEAVRLFEMSAARFPRSDYRPSWIYWAARAHDQLQNADTANARYAIVMADYQNSYYGRLASAALSERRVTPAATVPSSASAAPAGSNETGGTVTLPPTAAIIRTLIAHELYDDAVNELQYAQRAWGDSAAIQATLGLVYSRTGDLRRGINAMKRAYPHYITAGGEDLPVEMLKVLFPVAFWDQIKRHSRAHGLDPYMIAALMAQESTFDPQIRSHANAVGLMQILPSTGSRYARRIGLRRFRPSMLTLPDTNIRLGTAIFADLVARFDGGTHLALASYNAGEGAVARWVAERPGIPRDEFIDDIPYPETQNYVKRIVGTAEDYRRLYGELGATGLSKGATSAAAPSPDPARRRPKATPQTGTKAPASKKPTAKKPTAKKPTPKKPATKGPARTKKAAPERKAATAKTTGGSTRPTAR
jgi:soluble lytic murein transglycosylase